MEKIIREGFVFYRDFYEAIEDMPAEEFKSCMCAIMEYGLNGEDVTEAGTFEYAVLKMAKRFIDKNNEKYINGKKGGKSSVKQECETPNNHVDTKANQTEPNVTTPTPKEKDKEKDKDKDKDNIIYIAGETPEHTKRFVPPTIEEVKTYIAEGGYNINAEQFIDYYTARGWELLRGRKIKDWKACVRTWVRNGYDSARTNKAVTGYEQHGYTQCDFDEFRKNALAEMKHFEG